MVSRRSICNSDDGDSEGRRREAREVKVMMMMMSIMMMMMSIMMMMMMVIMSIMMMMMMIMIKMTLILIIRGAIHIWSF